MAKKVGCVSGSIQITDNITNRLVRLPLWRGLESKLGQVIDAALEATGSRRD
jgi:dTDP-4-amino-4,6-dideoxygalactose transaminase